LKISDVDVVFVYFTENGKRTFRSIATTSYEIDGNTLTSENNQHIINNVTGTTDYKDGKRLRSLDL
jgi:glutamine cyclotransferase